MKLIQHSLAIVTLFSGVALGQSPFADDYSGDVELSPEIPTASWPGPGGAASNNLSPNYTFTVKVDIKKEGMHAGRKYVLVPGSEKFRWEPLIDPGILWSKTDDGYKITNTARFAKETILTVTCRWIPADGGGGKGGAGGGLEGTADVLVGLANSTIQWYYFPKEQVQKYNALVSPQIDYDMYFEDENGFYLERCSVGTLTSVPVAPAALPWTLAFKPKIQDCLRSGTATVNHASVAQIKLNYSDGTPEESLSEELLIIPVQLVTPGGDPANAPVEGVAGATIRGANEFCFSYDTGKITLPLQAEAFHIGALRTSITDRFSFAVDSIGASVLAWSGGSAVAIPQGDLLVRTATFTGLPLWNTELGVKNARLLFDGMPIDERPFEVFYDKFAKNHPGNGSGSTPNWFYYWCQSAANMGNAPERYVGNSVSEYIQLEEIINLGDDCAGIQKPVWGSPHGIDSFAWVTAHEAKHGTQSNLFWPWPAGYIPDLDTGDFDTLPDKIEGPGPFQYMPDRDYRSDMVATFRDTIGYTNNPQFMLNDVEDIDMRAQVQVDGEYPLDVLWHNGDADGQDWAKPGKNSKDKF